MKTKLKGHAGRYKFTASYCLIWASAVLVQVLPIEGVSASTAIAGSLAILSGFMVS